ncbi:MAG: ferredoxin-thioredoxin reductase catalytic domain-containing protein [Desulfomicrobium sp.]|nr:ferredoxin-thioredoxin reductase catalytic domain-containing protein [Desulfomicrobium sp.]
MTPEELYEKLRPLQEEKGYFFNKDKEFVLELMESLLINRDRYGYMVCPCRLGSGNRELDKDIFCPCVYREPDVAEFGRCYCGLYASKEFNEGSITEQNVPERRDPEKLMAGLLFEE